MKRIVLGFVLSLAIGFVVVKITSAQVVPVPAVKSKPMPITSVAAPAELTATQEKESIKLSWQDHALQRGCVRVPAFLRLSGKYEV